MYRILTEKRYLFFLFSILKNQKLIFNDKFWLDFKLNRQKWEDILTFNTSSVSFKDGQSFKSSNFVSLFPATAAAVVVVEFFIWVNEVDDLILVVVVLLLLKASFVSFV